MRNVNVKSEEKDRWWELKQGGKSPGACGRQSEGGAKRDH